MDQPTKASTCGRCRTKKIRCDGGHPCGSCSRARIAVSCGYAPPSGSHGPELRKGAACTACRRKKKKCSGDWPCQTCIASKKEDDCKFNDNSQLSFTRALIERTLELEQLLADAKQTPPSNLDPQADQDVAAELNHLLSSNSLVPPESPFFDPDLFIEPTTLPASPEAEEGSLDLADVTYDATDASGSSSIVALPPETTEHKMFRLRRKFLAKRIQFGFILPAHKHVAIMNGDLSGAIVHPVLVHVCHLWGYMLDFCEHNNTWHPPPNNSDEVAQMRLILGSIAGIRGPPPDSVTALIAYMTVSLYFFHKHDFSRGQEFLAMASNVALKNDLDLAALSNFHVEDETKTGYSMLPLTSAEELRSAFSMLICIAANAQVVLSTPLAIDSRLLETFHHLMPTHLPNNADLNFLRAKTTVLMKQTRELTSAWNNDKSPATLWFDQYWKLVEQLHALLGILNPMQLRISFIPDSHTTDLLLKLCCIIAFAALADLHSMFAPSHTESSKRYRDAVFEIVSLTGTFSMDDCQYLDPILPLCWSIATKRILDNKVVYQSQEPIIAAIRSCNQSLKQMLPLVTDFERISAQPGPAIPATPLNLA